jgi:hypothetical protein
MALPSAWTEPLLIGAMEAEVEGVLDNLGLLDTDLIATAVEQDTPAVLGVSSVAAVAYGSVADVIKVRVIAQWCTWQRAYDKAITSSDLKAGSVTLSDSQAFEHLRERLAMAARAAARYPEAALAMMGQPRTPAIGALTTTAPVSPPWTGGIDANDPRYTGSPYAPTRTG